MTMNEKKLNKVDLHAYRNIEGQVYAVVPGIHHYDTIASVPLAHTGAPQMDLEQAAAGRAFKPDLNNTIRDNNAIYKRKQMELDLKRSSAGSPSTMGN